MKVQELRGLAPGQLVEELLRLKKEQFNLRFRKASGQLEDTSRVRHVRRATAVVLTILRQKKTARVVE